MPPKRPPPLPRSLFQGNGPLAPGSAPLPPEASSIHPAFIFDAHHHQDAKGVQAKGSLFEGLPGDAPRPPFRRVMKIGSGASIDTASDEGSTESQLVHPKILDLKSSSPSTDIITAKSPVDILVPVIQPPSNSQWDVLEEAVTGIDKAWEEAGLASSMAAASVSQTQGTTENIGNGSGDKKSSGKIVISGLLPPPFTQPSSALARDPTYELYCGRLAQLSLQGNLYLKVLPPIIAEGNEGIWTGDQKEVSRVLKMYLSPAIETFGTHRILFGSSTALPIHQLAQIQSSSQSQSDALRLDQPVPENEWYAVLRKAVTELGETDEAVTGIFGGNAVEVYGL